MRDGFLPKPFCVNLWGVDVGKIFGGGGKTTVVQEAQAASDVNVNIENIIDLDGIAQVFEGASEVFQGLLERDIHTRQADVLVRLQGNEVDGDRLSTMKKAGNILLAGTAIYLVYKGTKR